MNELMFIIFAFQVLHGESGEHIVFVARSVVVVVSIVPESA